jgi:outer membrane protein OmpA-like peptidoglycan-associated protein
MKALLALVLALFLAGCASGGVTLLPGEGDAKVGSVVVLDPKTGAERGALTAANTRTALASKVSARPTDPALYASLTSALPAPPAHFTLNFFEGTTRLVPGSEPELQRMFAEIAKRSGAEVQITGHTDTVGNDADNDKLSLDRAREIRDALVARGLNPAITRAVGRGKRDLAVATPDHTPEEANRRVEVIVR